MGTSPNTDVRGRLGRCPRRLGDAATPADLTRTPAQRRHDALVEMAVRSMTAPPNGQRPAPLVTVVVGYETFAGPVSELARGTVLAPGTVADLPGHDATLLQRVVFEGADRITDISSARTFRGTLRRLLDVKQRRCDHETCFVPAHRCEGDHIVPWSAGAPTSQANANAPADPDPGDGSAAPRSHPIGACRRVRRHRLVLRTGDGAPVRVELTPGGSAWAGDPAPGPPAG